MLFKKSKDEISKEINDLNYLLNKYKNRQKEYNEQMTKISPSLTTKVLEIYEKAENNSFNGEKADAKKIFSKVEDLMKNDLDQQNKDNYGKIFYNYVMNDFKLKQAINLLKTDN